MPTKSGRIVGGLLLIVAGVLIGHGVGQMISELTGKSVSGTSIIGLGIGLINCCCLYNDVEKIRMATHNTSFLAAPL